MSKDDEKYKIKIHYNDLISGDGFKHFLERILEEKNIKVESEEKLKVLWEKKKESSEKKFQSSPDKLKRFRFVHKKSGY